MLFLFEFRRHFLRHTKKKIKMFLYAFSLFELCTNLLKTEVLVMTCQQSENKVQWYEDTEPEDKQEYPGSV